MKKKNSPLFLLLGKIMGLFVVLLISIGVNFFSSGKYECPVELRSKTVRGSSLYPLIEDGEEVEALFGYYDCGEIERGDVILYDYSGNDNLLIKVVRGVPEDEFRLIEEDSGWRISINGAILKNSVGDFYLLNENGYNMLSMYERDYGGIIPESAYLLLSEKVSGAMDSSRFGLVHKGDILAKVTNFKSK